MKHPVTLPRTYAHTHTQDPLESFNKYIERKTRMELWFVRVFYSFVLMALIAELYLVYYFGEKVMSWLLK